MSVKFVSYTGKWPNLCSGVLTLNIDGVDVRFGHDSSSYSYKTMKYEDDNYDSFWSSGGCTYFNDDYTESYIETEKWIIDEADIPETYRKHYYEIKEVFNDNVPWGCCGGCL